jgi:hypothetical protein
MYILLQNTWIGKENQVLHCFFIPLVGFEPIFHIENPHPNMYEVTYREPTKAWSYVVGSQCAVWDELNGSQGVTVPTE